jgi:hypothetical protein
MSKVKTIAPNRAYERVSSGQATLVCAYKDERKCDRLALQDAISLAQLRKLDDEIDADAELLFYCN